jgi:phosphohistidine phosphatase
MKTLLIMRHAKASWENSECSDFERPLTQFGLQAAPFMGNVIYQNGLQPNLIICSSAKRARQTAVLIRAVAEIKANIEYREEIYGARPATFLQIAVGIEEKHESVLFIGHNPEIEDFVRVLTGENQSMPTAAIAIVTLNIEKWSEIAANCGRLDEIIRPKELMEKAKIQKAVLKIKGENSNNC